MFKERLLTFTQIVLASLIAVFCGLISGVTLHVILKVFGLSIDMVYKILLSILGLLIVAGVIHTFKWLIIEPYIDYRKQKGWVYDSN